MSGHLLDRRTSPSIKRAMTAVRSLWAVAPRHFIEMQIRRATSRSRRFGREQSLFGCILSKLTSLQGQVACSHTRENGKYKDEGILYRMFGLLFAAGVLLVYSVLQTFVFCNQFAYVTAGENPIYAPSKLLLSMEPRWKLKLCNITFLL